MTDIAATASPDLTALTVQLLSAYVANNKIEHGDLAGLIQSTKAALGAPETSVAEPEPEPEAAHKRAVSINKSLANHDQIISMIDGKAYKTLTRHLKKHGLSPADYRARYKLPADYPLIAPGYSEQRRQVARNLGLGGRKRAAPAEPDRTPEAAPPVADAAAPTEAVAKPRARRAAARKGNGASAAREAPAAATPPAEAAPASRKRRAGTSGKRSAGADAPDGGAPQRRGRRRTPPTAQA